MQYLVNLRECEDDNSNIDRFYEYLNQACYNSGACSTHGSDEKCILILVGNPEGETLLGTSRRIWEDNISMDLRDIGWEGVDWTLAQYEDKWRAL
jgi:hypothetical protein